MRPCILTFISGSLCRTLNIKAAWKWVHDPWLASPQKAAQAVALRSGRRSGLGVDVQITLDATLYISYGESLMKYAGVASE
jgi:hypothetical protein